MLVIGRDTINAPVMVDFCAISLAVTTITPLSKILPTVASIGTLVVSSNELKYVFKRLRAFAVVGLLLWLLNQTVSPEDAFRSPRNGGLGFSGLLLNSGWYWTPT